MITDSADASPVVPCGDGKLSRMDIILIDAILVQDTTIETATHNVLRAILDSVVIWINTRGPLSKNME